MRRAAVGAAAALMALAAWASPAAASTSVQRVHPYQPDGSLSAGYTAIRRSGSCNTVSFVDPRSDAFRCFTGNRVRDPCFRNPADGAEVACLRSPWDRRAVKVRSQLPVRRSSPHIYWALSLRTRRCVFVSGATNVVRGRRLNYVCTRGRFAFGSPSKRSTTWTILVARDTRGHGLRRVPIRIAWN